MTTDTLRQLSHENLVSYVRGRLSTPTAPDEAPASDDPDRASRYLRNDDAPTVRITPYPKRRGVLPGREPRVSSRDALAPAAAAELCYQDFFRAEPAVLAPALAVAS